MGKGAAHCKAYSAVSGAKTIEPIEMPFGLCTRDGPRKHVLEEGAYWCQLASTIEPFICGGDAAFFVKLL